MFRNGNLPLKYLPEVYHYLGDFAVAAYKNDIVFSEFKMFDPIIQIYTNSTDSLEIVYTWSF